MDRSAFGRKDRLIKERRHDVYAEKRKRRDPTVCSECSALMTNGRWTWGKRPHDAREAVCPACRRIAERVPAGRIELEGPFFEAHREEIMNLVHNVETQEKNQHPLERIMTLRKGRRTAAVTTTGVHVARRIGETIASAYKGDLSIQYPPDEGSIRVYWQR
jgi:hypothetical protein